MNVVIGAKTDPGRRSNNEDQLAVVDVQRLRLQADAAFMVADGMGGRQMGEQAAALAVETIQETLLDCLGSGHSMPSIQDALTASLQNANKRVYDRSRSTEDGRGMGTTCVAAVVKDGTAFVAHAGDSRAYLLHDGRLQRMTEDHSYVAEQVKAGTITEEGARQSRFRNVITRAIGIDATVNPELTCQELSIGDSLLLCSDGLTNAVDEADITQTLKFAPSPQSAAERLVQQAIRAGGKDNITAVVARFEVGNQTQQMPLKDIHPGKASANGSGFGAPRTKTIRDIDTGNQSSASANSSARSSALPMIAAIVIVLLLIGNGVLLGMLFRHTYNVPHGSSQTAPPVTMPSARQKTHVPNFAQLTYMPPALFYIKPVQGGFLSVQPTTGAITAITLDDDIVRLSPGGTLISSASLPSGHADSDIPVFAAVSDQYTAVDPAGDIYISRPSQGEIIKYSSSLVPLGHIPGLSSPAAIAVAGDGTVYVVDNERLKVIRPMTSP